MHLLHRKLWDKYDLQFPIEQEKAYIIGENGSGKTHLLEHLRDYFEEQGERVLYFKDDRFLVLEPADMYAIIKKHTALRQIFGMDKDSFIGKYDIDTNQLMLERETEKIIHRGKIQLVNFFCTILHEPKDVIVLIDEPERNLHIGSRDTLIDDLFALRNVKKIVVATHCPSILDVQFAVDIHHCLIKHESA